MKWQHPRNSRDAWDQDRYALQSAFAGLLEKVARADAFDPLTMAIWSDLYRAYGLASIALTNAEIVLYDEPAPAEGGDDEPT